MNNITNIEQISDEQKDGNCFESAYRNVFFNKQYKLVHGIVTGQGNIEGIKYIHAWCEFENKVFDTSNERNIVMPKEMYYDIGKIEYTVEYTFKEAVQNVLDTEHYGYWHKIFNELNHIQKDK